MDKDEIAKMALSTTNLALKELEKEGKDPDAVIELTQRDLTHIASLSTQLALVGMKEQMDNFQEAIKEYVLMELSNELGGMDDIDKKMKRLTQRIDTVYNILDGHYEIIVKLTQDIDS